MTRPGASALARRPSELSALRAGPGDLVSATPAPAPTSRRRAAPRPEGSPPGFPGVVADTREQTPWFLGEPWCQVGTLQIGDYSLRGHEARPAILSPGMVAVERKSLEDLYGTVSASVKEKAEQEKAGEADPTGRGERQWRKLSSVVAAGGGALFVVEASMTEILHPDRYRPDWRSQLHPHAVLGCLNSWSLRYRVPWLPAGPPAQAAQVALSWLVDWWKQWRRAELARLEEEI